MTQPAARPGPEVNALAYAPPPRWHRRRRFRRAVGVVLLLAAGAAAWRYGKSAWTRGRLLYYQRQCLAYTAPPDQVVYEQDPVRAAALLSRGSYTNVTPAGGPPEAALTPRCWAEACRLAGGLTPPAAGATAVSGGGSSGATLFLHERRSPGGQRRLVAVQSAPGLPALASMPVLVEPGSLTAIPSVRAATLDADFDLSLPTNPAGTRFRFFAGQADPSDPSHFTLRFTAEGVPGSVEGWLRDNDCLKVKVSCAAPFGRASGRFSGAIHVGSGAVSVQSMKMSTGSTAFTPAPLNVDLSVNMRSFPATNAATLAPNGLTGSVEAALDLVDVSTSDSYGTTGIRVPQPATRAGPTTAASQPAAPSLAPPGTSAKGKPLRTPRGEPGISGAGRLWDGGVDARGASAARGAFRARNSGC